MKELQENPQLTYSGGYNQPLISVKACSTCHKEKPFNEFIKNKNCKNGISGTCAKCHYEKTKKYALEHPAQVKQSKEKYKLNNVEKIRQRRKEIRIADPERFKKYQEKTRSKDDYKSYDPEYYQKNKERIKVNQQKYKLANSEKCKLSAKKTRIKRVEENKITRRLWRKRNTEECNRKRSLWRKNNPEKVREEKNKITETLKGSYVKRGLIKQGFPKDQITTELIEVQRLIIKTKRLCKTLQNSEQV